MMREDAPRASLTGKRVPCHSYNLIPCGARGPWSSASAPSAAPAGPERSSRISPQTSDESESSASEAHLPADANDVQLPPGSESSRLRRQRQRPALREV